MELLLVLWAVGAATAAFTHVAHGAEGAQQFPSQEPAGYAFGYSHTHGSGGAASWRKESADAAGNVVGSYGLKDADGRVRLVTYTANGSGFKADVQSNEPGLPQYPGLGAGITHWPTPSPRYARPLEPAPHQGAWDGGSPHGTPGHAGGPGGYDFAYGQDIGPFQKESGNAAGSKKGVYGLKDLDGRTRTVTYEADEGGFRATVQSNEPGVDDAEDPADVDVSKAPEPAGIALVYSGPPESVPVGATLVSPSGSGAPGVADAADDGGAPSVPGLTGLIDTGFGQQDGSGTYNFAYGGEQVQGPWQKESGDSAGNKAGSYGLKESDGRFRTVNYVAGPEGFRATIGTNEPGVDGARNPADVVVNKSPEAVGIVPVVGPVGLPPTAGVVPGHSPVPATGGILGVQGQAILPAAPLVPNVAGLPAVPPLHGTVGLSGTHGFPAGPANLAISGPVYHGGAGFTAPSSGGGYSFGYSGGPGGAFHRETGDPSGTKTGVFGFSADSGAVRTVNYVADAGGFRASVQANEPGVDISQNPADVSQSAPGGPAPFPGGPHQHHGTPAGQANAGSPPTQLLPPLTSAALGPWSPGSLGSSFSWSHAPGSFYYKTEVLGPHRSISEVHHY